MCTEGGCELVFFQSRKQTGTTGINYPFSYRLLNTINIYIPPPLFLTSKQRKKLREIKQRCGLEKRPPVAQGSEFLYVYRAARR